MKITIEPTTKDNGYPTVSISIDSDEADLPTCISQLVIPALIGWGYNPKGINDYIEDPDL